MKTEVPLTVVPRSSENNIIRVQMEKWGGRPHYRYGAARLGEDEFGVWAATRAGADLVLGEASPGQFPNASIMLIPRGVMWVASWIFLSSSSPEFDYNEIYVNITTPPQWKDELVVAVDLDLDVVRQAGGAVEIKDEDEFEVNRAEFGYPRDVVDGAIRATQEIKGALMRRTQPFDQTPSKWLAAFRSVTG